MRSGSWRVTVMISLLGLVNPLTAQPAMPMSARLSLIAGHVWVMSDDSGNWVEAVEHARLAPGDKVSTGDGACAEIELGYAAAFRLAERTEARVAELTSTGAQLVLLQGMAQLRVFNADSSVVQIHTPTVSVRPLLEGTYRMQVDSIGETRVMVRSGKAEVAAAQGSVTVGEGQLIQIRGVEEPLYRIVKAPPLDDWDRWNWGRDLYLAQPRDWCLTPRTWGVFFPPPRRPRY